MEPVRSHRNKTVVEAARLHRSRVRRDTGETLLEGPALVEDAIAAGCRIRVLFADEGDQRAHQMARESGIDLVLVDRRAMQRLAGTETPRGPVGVAEIPHRSLEFNRDVLVSWGVSDPGNVGTLIRTAASFGWSYAYTAGSADPWSPKTLRAGAGGQFQTGIARLANIAELDDWATVATVPRGGVAPDTISGERIAVLIGSEAGGLPENVSGAADHLVTIPTRGATESLNAAVAAGIVVYEISKRSGQDQGTV